MDVFEALKFLSANRFFRFGDSFSKFYLNFKLKGKHYYKAFWIDYNGSFNKLLIREGKHRYRNLNLDRVERVVINFYQPPVLRDVNDVHVLDRVDLVEFCNVLKRTFYMEDFYQRFRINVGNFDLVFERQVSDYKLRMKLRAKYSSLYRVFCLLRSLESITEDDVVDIIQSKKFVIFSSLGDELRLVQINNKDVSEF